MLKPVVAADARVSVGPLCLTSGAVLPDVTVAFASYGRLDPDGRNAILVTHGYTASHHMLAHGDGVAEGSWAPLIGPGKPLDTDRYLVVCSNMLGSSYGTTGPASTDPRTGRPYGLTFPEIDFADIVEVQRRLLVHLGVKHLRAVVGPSYGGFQALQWALDHPSWVDAIGVVLSGPYFPRTEQTDLAALDAHLASDPVWCQGTYPAPGEMQATLRTLRIQTLKAYGMEAVLADQGLQGQAKTQRLEAMAGAWAREFDPAALQVLLRAGLRFDVRARLPEIKARVLHVIANTDTLFPPNDQHRSELAGVGSPSPVHYLEIDTPYGHTASGPAHEQWGDALRQLLQDRQRDRFVDVSQRGVG